MGCGCAKGSSLIVCLLVLVGCSGPAETIWAPDSEIRKFAYRHEGPAELRLYTVVSTRNGSGAHSGLLINTPFERILFDPAGTFKLPFVPERNDVHYGMTDNALRVYIDYHARETFDVIEQRVPVTEEQALLAARLAKDYGAVPKAQCSLAITRILSQLPDFEMISVTYFPNGTYRRFSTRPGVVERRISDDDADKNHNVLFRASRAVR